jgi:hypothetical protein
MVIWEDGDPYKPSKNDTCMMCRGPLRLPLILWQVWRDHGRHKYICSSCCADMHSGFPADLRTMAAARRLQDLGFKPEEKICSGDRVAPMFDIQH